MLGIFKIIIFTFSIALCHNISNILYTQYCSSNSILGFFFTLISISTPQCRLLLYIQLYTSDIYYYIIISSCYICYAMFKNFFINQSETMNRI